MLKNNQYVSTLRISRLNTELYPLGYNTFNSFGEYLSKMGAKKEAIEAYNQSLQLIQNAIKFLNDNDGR